MCCIEYNTKLQRHWEFYVKAAYWKSKKTILCIAMGGLEKIVRKEVILTLVKRTKKRYPWILACRQ